MYYTYVYIHACIDGGGGHLVSAHWASSWYKSWKVSTVTLLHKCTRTLTLQHVYLEARQIQPKKKVCVPRSTTSTTMTTSTVMIVCLSIPPLAVCSVGSRVWGLGFRDHQGLGFCSGTNRTVRIVCLSRSLLAPRVCFGSRV